MVSALSSKPSDRARAAAVKESSPPLSKTTASTLAPHPSQHSALSSQHPALSIQLSAPSTQHLAPSTLLDPSFPLRPKELMKLQLQSGSDAVLQHPFRQRLRLERTMDRR